MKNKKISILTLAFAFLPSIAMSSSTFDFNSIPIGTGTPITLSSNGITAVFSAPGDPGGFQINPTFFSFPGNILYTPGINGQDFENLDIAFSQLVSEIHFNFATNGAGPLTLIALSGGISGTQVGEVSVLGQPVLFFFPEGLLTFNGALFDTVKIIDSNDPNFAIGNVTVSAVPVPAAVWLFGSGLMGVLSFKRSKNKTANVITA